MSKERQRRRKRAAFAHDRNRPVRATADRAAAILSGPLGRLLADQFFAAHPSLSMRWADDPERRYSCFSRLVEAKIVRFTLDGERIGIEFNPEIGAAMRKFVGNEQDPDVLAERLVAMGQEGRE